MTKGIKQRLRRLFGIAEKVSPYYPTLSATDPELFRYAVQSKNLFPNPRFELIKLSLKVKSLRPRVVGSLP